MKHLTKILIAFCLFGFGTTLLAQNSISSTGGIATGSGGTMSYTVGQVVYLTISGTTGTATQGVQQPYEISVITGIEESGILLECLIYPNPATGFIMLKIKNYDFEKLYFQLYDINGNLLQSNKLEGDQTQIQMESLKSGTYFLKVHDITKDLKTFKIIKN